MRWLQVLRHDRGEWFAGNFAPGNCYEARLWHRNPIRFKIAQRLGENCAGVPRKTAGIGRDFHRCIATRAMEQRSRLPPGRITHSVQRFPVGDTKGQLHTFSMPRFVAMCSTSLAIRAMPVCTSLFRPKLIASRNMSSESVEPSLRGNKSGDRGNARS
jgi:hypothetical protein